MFGGFLRKHDPKEQGVMAVAALVMMAAEEMDSAADVDVFLYELRKSNHRDETWRDVVDALLDVRSLIVERHPLVV